MDDLLPRLPALAGWLTTWILLLVGMRIVAPSGPGQKAAALLHLASAVPVAEWVSGSLRGALGLGARFAADQPELAQAIDAGVIGVGLHSVALVVGGWFAGILLQATDDEPPPRPKAAPKPPPKAPPAAPRPAVIRPAGQTFAASVGAPGPSARAEDDARANHLLAMLEEGSDFHRVAACRALLVPFADSHDERVGEALLALIEDSDVDSALRAEATITLGMVFSSPAPNPDELRDSFSSHLDKAWLDAVRTDVRG